MTERETQDKQPERLPQFGSFSDIDYAQMVCDEHLLHIYDHDEATQWWHAHHPILKGVPLILFKSEPQRVMDYVFSMRSKESLDY